MRGTKASKIIIVIWIFGLFMVYLAFGLTIDGLFGLFMVYLWLIYGLF